MAFPVVAARNFSKTSATDVTGHQASLPTGIAAGHLLVVVYSVDGNPVCSTSSTGWVMLGQGTDASNAVTSAVFYKLATSSEPPLVMQTTQAQQSSNLSFRITGADSTITGTPSSGSSTNSDPPDHTPGAAADYLWIATRSGDSTTVATVAPTNYSNLQSNAGIGTNSASTNSAERSLNASSENPGTFTSGNEQWVCWTLAIAPPGSGSLVLTRKPNYGALLQL